MPAVPARTRYTIRQVLDWTARDLAQAGAESPRLDAELLLAHALGFTRTELLTRLEEPADPAERGFERFEHLAFRRSRREPVAYILGEKPFHNLRLGVSPAALIPRPETELLVEQALRLIPGLRRTFGPVRLRVLDLCTGSGAIALALAYAHAEADYLGTDASTEALALAETNARRLGLAGIVSFRLGDRFAPLQPGERFHLLTCNPPYIPSAVVETLMPEASYHEPRAALDGGGDGIRFIASILPRFSDVLEPGGWAVVEIGDGQEDQILALTPPGLEASAPVPDLSGTPRILLFQKLEK